MTNDDSRLKDVLQPLPWIGSQAPTASQSSSSERRQLFELLDARPIEYVHLIAHRGSGPGGRYSRPDVFVDAKGKRYLAKRRSQQGLFAELFGGRLAMKLGVGPACTTGWLPRGLAPAGTQFGDHDEYVFLSEEVPDVIGREELEAFAAGQSIGLPVDPRSRAAVVAFHTWIDAKDEQVLVRATDGMVYTIDHGASFDALPPGPPTRIVVAEVRGAATGLGRRWEFLEPMIERIEHLTERDILEAATAIPDDPTWLASAERRYKTAAWLIKRQFGLRERLHDWAHVA